MDKFDEFLNEKAKHEEKEFNLPESFDLKVENTLKCLTDDKKDKWYINKKIVSIAACFIVALLVGLRYTSYNNLVGLDNSSVMEMAIDNTQRRDLNTPQIANNETQDTEKVFINKDDINGLTIKSLLSGAKFKSVNKKEDIDSIVDCINNLNKSEVIDQGISEWDFLIQTSGVTNHSIEIKGNLINIDNKYYELNENVSDIIKNIYSDLNYEEKDINYCNVNY